MNEEDKKLQKQLVDEMMKVSKTNPDVMIYMQALMESYEKLKQELDQYKNNWEELKKWLKDISYIEGNDDFCTGFNRAICGMREDILNKIKKLEEGK